MSDQETCAPRTAPKVSHPLVITSDGAGQGKALLTVPFTMVLRNVRACSSSFPTRRWSFSRRTTSG